MTTNLYVRLQHCNEKSHVTFLSHIYPFNVPNRPPFRTNVMRNMLNIWATYTKYITRSEARAAVASIYKNKEETALTKATTRYSTETQTQKPTALNRWSLNRETQTHTQLKGNINVHPLCTDPEEQGAGWLADTAEPGRNPSAAARPRPGKSAKTR